MKRILTLFIALTICLTLTGCSKAVGGLYRLDYITTDGVRMSPTTFGMSMSFELLEDGVGTAVSGPNRVDITWTEDGSDVVVTGADMELRFSRDGDNLVLHDNGTMLFFVLEEEEEEETKKG